jgi:hypothetical protein
MMLHDHRAPGSDTGAMPANVLVNARGSGDDLAEPQVRATAVVRRPGHQPFGEHRISEDHAGDCARDLRDDVRNQFAAGQAGTGASPEPPVGD